jgi:hypothetical protein
MDLKVKTEPESDPAAKAFIEMRNAVAGMTMAVNKMAGEWNALEIPDYTETLGKMATNFEALAEEVEELSSKPALELTPDALAKQIAAAGAAARKAEQESLASATATFVKLGSEMAGFLASARTENEQNKWVLVFGGLCLALGLVAATVLPGPIYIAPCRKAGTGRRRPQPICLIAICGKRAKGYRLLPIPSGGRCGQRSRRRPWMARSGSLPA